MTHDGSDERTVMVHPSLAAAPTRSRADWEHYLVVLEGEEVGRRVRLSDQALRIGRRAPCEWIVGDGAVSSLHCEISARPGEDEARVTDHGSTNGTYVDGARIAGTASLPMGALLLVGRQLFKHEFRAPHEARRSDELDRDLERASRHIRSLLPAPLREGPVRIDWVFEPSTQLGGDALGYLALDERRHAVFLFDVSGHGIGAAVHTVSVLNVLRQRALPGADFADPSQVLTRLNQMFQMDDHGGLLFTLWYGVFDRVSQSLHYASAGHHPAYLVDGARSELLPLQTRNTIIGALPDATFHAATAPLLPGSTLYVFSDGVFEIETADGSTYGLEDFRARLLDATDEGQSEPERLWQLVRQRAKPGPLDDDFSLLTLSFQP